MQFRDRIIEFVRVRASELLPHPHNWRTHPQPQREALRGVLEEIGLAGAVLARRLENGRLQLIDGHLRAAALGEHFVPVLVLDVTEEEADKLLLAFDPLSSMAGTDEAQLRALLRRVEPDNPTVREMFAQIEQTASDTSTAVRPPEATDFQPVYGVIVDCADEAQQRAAYEHLKAAGFRCRLTML